MKKIFLKTMNPNPHFIGSWSIEPSSICDDLINYFELNISKQKTIPVEKKFIFLKKLFFKIFIPQ